MRNCEGRSSTPVRLEAEPTVDALKIEEGICPLAAQAEVKVKRALILARPSQNEQTGS